MRLTYDQLVQWIGEYFEVFNKYGQDPNEIHRMDEYFAKDFVFNPYIAYVGKVSGRDNWYKVLTSHPSGIERLTPEDLVIDENRQVFRRADQDRPDRPRHSGGAADQALSGALSADRRGRQDEDREARFLLGDPAGRSSRDRRRIRKGLEETGGPGVRRTAYVRRDRAVDEGLFRHVQLVRPGRGHRPSHGRVLRARLAVHALYVRVRRA